MSSLFEETGENWRDTMKGIYEGLSGETLKSSSTFYMVFSAVAYIVLLICKFFNLKYTNQWLKTCDEETTILYGDDRGLTRDSAEASRITVRFTRISNLSNTQSIPLGTRVCYGEYLFDTVETYTFGVNESIIDCVVECETEGSETNGIVSGSTFSIIDAIPHTTSCVSTSESTGGSDQETLSNFKEKIRSFPESYSCAGTKGAYEYFAMKADSSIAKSYAYNKSAGIAGIVILLKDGVLPSAEMINKVQTYLSIEEIRALNDKIEVSEPEVVRYSIDISFYVGRTNEASAGTIATNSKELIESLTNKLSNSLGGSINPETFRNIILNAGGKRTIIREPSYLALEKNQVCICEDINVILAGVEDD